MLDGGEPEVVSVPPVHETELSEAARNAGCELRRARPGDQLIPPVTGSLGAAPVRPGIYEEPQDGEALFGALSEGIVVIQFSGLDDDGLELLRELQEALPDGTIVAPNEAETPFAVTIASYRRLLGCRELNKASADAIQLFRGRFVGSGPG